MLLLAVVMAVGLVTLSISWGPHRAHATDDDSQAGQICANDQEGKVVETGSGKWLYCNPDQFPNGAGRWEDVTQFGEPEAGQLCPVHNAVFEDLICKGDHSSNGDGILVWKLPEQPETSSPTSTPAPDLPLTGSPTVLLSGLGLGLVGLGTGGLVLARFLGRRPSSS